jgi:uncharacterized protein with GYD domain
MPKYLAVGAYSAGTWARMMRSMDDRVEIARKFAESLGGPLDCIYWEIGTRKVSQDQLTDALTVAKDVSQIYQVPGHTAGS